MERGRKWIKNDLNISFLLYLYLKFKEWREADVEMQKNEEKAEEKIRMLKKERNRQRADAQKRSKIKENEIRGRSGGE